MNGKIYFASDFHLGAPDEKSSKAREKLLVSWLDVISKDASEIYLLGDVFDFWFEYKKVIPKGYSRFLGKLAELSDKGIAITCFKGNHDMWMFGYLEQEFGIKIVSNELELIRNEKKFFLHHGDGLGPGDYSYKFLRKIFRNRLCQWLFGKLHPDFGIWLASKLSSKSRIKNTKHEKQYLGDDKEFLTQFAYEYLKNNHIDYFIFGHRHLPVEIELKNGSKYLNLGEWVNDSYYACFDGESLVLKKFDGR